MSDAYKSIRHSIYFRIGALYLALATVLAAPCSAQPQAEAATIRVQGMLLEKTGKVAKDLSGIACLPPASNGTRECLLINDESRAAQRATLGGTTLTAGAMVPLIGDDVPAGALGSRPEVNCPGGLDGFGEFDGEGVTYVPGAAAAGGVYYVVGSHGCSRKKDVARLSSFLLARVPVTAEGVPSAPELTWRLADALKRSPALATAFARSLNTANGLNIEAIAAAGSDLLFGMRAPVEGDRTFIARVSAIELFAPGSSGGLTAQVRSIRLGVNAGIRDMATLPDGRLLVLSGPAQEQKEVRYAFWAFDLGQTSDEPTKLAELEDVMDGPDRAKAEAIHILSVAGGDARIIVLFDGIRNGGPREYHVVLR